MASGDSERKKKKKDRLRCRDKKKRHAINGHCAVKKKREKGKKVQPSRLRDCQKKKTGGCRAFLREKGEKFGRATGARKKRPPLRT